MQASSHRGTAITSPVLASARLPAAAVIALRALLWLARAAGYFVLFWLLFGLMMLVLFGPFALVGQ